MRLTPVAQGRRKRWLVAGGIFFLLVVLSMPVALATSPALEMLKAAYAADAPYRNAIYLWLRIAGILWITVEWVAGIVLWRAWVHLRRAAREAGLSS